MRRTSSPPWLIILIGIGFLALSAWSIRAAARGASAVTDADYYSHGLRYNQTLLEQRAADSLGWQLTFAHGGGELQVTLSDARQLPISGAKGVLTIFRSDLAQPQRLLLHEASAGSYRVTPPVGLGGEVTAQVDFELDGARLQRRLLVVLPRP